MRKVVEQIKSFYEKGIYSLVDIERLLLNGKITQEEYSYIVTSINNN